MLELIIYSFCASVSIYLRIKYFTDYFFVTFQVQGNVSVEYKICIKAAAAEAEFGRVG